MTNYYIWLEKNLSTFLEKNGIDPLYDKGLIRVFGTRCQEYREFWKLRGIPFVHGLAIYMISKLSPYEEEVQHSHGQGITTYQWVYLNYDRFKDGLNSAEGF